VEREVSSPEETARGPRANREGRPGSRSPRERDGTSVLPTAPLKWRLLASLLPTGSGHILDCGCGDGGLSLYLRDRGWRVRGVEADAELASLARAAGLAVAEADLESAATWQSLGGGYDAVIFSDVLEHLDDPRWVLRYATSVLRPGGGILVSLPSVSFWRVRLDLMAGRWQYQDAGILDRTHRWFFTRSSMMDLFSETGLHVASMSPLPTSSPGMGACYQRFWTGLARVRPTLFAVGFLWWLERDEPR
jgi:2-polyprenyl-3-methyl-5-hydroxy-6-metoxy-1,4-benzoquinol methylase